MREMRKGQSNKLSSGIFNLWASVGVKCRTNVLRGWLAFPLPDPSLSIRLAEGPTYPGLREFISHGQNRNGQKIKAREISHNPFSINTQRPQSQIGLVWLPSACFLAFCPGGAVVLLGLFYTRGR